MVKRRTKRPTKKGIKPQQRQKQNQSVIVNVNTNKTRIRRQPLKPKKHPQFITTYPVFMESLPSPPIIYNREPAKQETVNVPIGVLSKKKLIEPTIETEQLRTNSKFTFGKLSGSATPEVVKLKTYRTSRIPILKRNIISSPTHDEAVVKLTDTYQTPVPFEYTNTTPIARRTRGGLALSAEEVERRRLLRNENARMKRLEKRMMQVE